MRKSWSQQLDCWWWRWANLTHFFHPLKSSMWTIGIWKVQLWHWFSWSLVLPIPSLASWKLGWKKKYFFIINKAMFTCYVGRLLVGNLWKSWRCKKTNQEKSKNCCIFLHIKVAVVGTPDENHGLENWKIQAHKTQELLVGSLRKFDERLVDFFAMGSCKNVKFERLGPQSFCNGNFSVFFWWEYRRFLWSNGGKSNSFKRLNTTLTMSREPWWWAAQLV